MGAVARLTWSTFFAFWRLPIELRPLINQFDTAGIQSWSITVLTAVFTGMVLALQFSTGLEPYGASMYTGKLAALGIVRELGPMLTALLVGGRVGSGFAAELGSMVVTEQVDAIRALGADPIKKLVAPRVFACVLVLPLLTMLANVVGPDARVDEVRRVRVHHRDRRLLRRAQHHRRHRGRGPLDHPGRRHRRHRAARVQLLPHQALPGAVWLNPPLSRRMASPRWSPPSRSSASSA
jgi:hypothetical protein